MDDGDSECTLASLEKVKSEFCEYFCNRIGEMINFKTNIEKYCPVGNNSEVVAYRKYLSWCRWSTGTDSEIIDIAEDSEWQNGPSYLKIATKSLAHRS